MIGVGTDLMRIERIQNSMDNAAFLSAVYTRGEREQAGLRDKPLLYYATRYAGKEAVYKCFGQMPGEVRLNEIELLEGENGKPFVRLSGNCLALASSLGIEHIELSLSYDGEYALAFAVAEGAPPTR